MHYLLINSPLVTSTVWAALTPELKLAGHSVSVVVLHNEINHKQSFFACHLQQLNRVLADERLALKDVIVVSHSGAGPVLALLDSKRLAATIMLDSIFPQHGKSRFQLFDSQTAIDEFTEVARKNDGYIPAKFIRLFAKAITDPKLRAEFESGLSDVPVALYEEPMSVSGSWPEHPGLYVQWTDAYRHDLECARESGFQVSCNSGSHFEMLNAPKAVAESMLKFTGNLDLQ